MRIGPKIEVLFIHCQLFAKLRPAVLYPSPDLNPNIMPILLDDHVNGTLSVLRLRASIDDLGIWVKLLVMRQRRDFGQIELNDNFRVGALLLLKE